VFGDTARHFGSRCCDPAGGAVLAGEPFWKQEPAAEYLAWSGLERSSFGTHAENVEAREAEGLVPLVALVATATSGIVTKRCNGAPRQIRGLAPGRHGRHGARDPCRKNRHEYVTWAATRSAGRCTSSRSRAAKSGFPGLEGCHKSGEEARSDSLGRPTLVRNLDHHNCRTPLTVVPASERAP